MPDGIGSDETREGKEIVVMAEIDLKFMKGNRALAKAMGNTYKAGKAAPKKKTASKGKKKK